MLDRLLLVNDMVRAFVWGVPLLVLLLGAGMYFTIETGFFQLRCAPLWLRRTLGGCFSRAARRGATGAPSPFATMCTALAATVGTGNIAGVATALTLGGPGAVFWMWISAFFGMMLAFAENVLGILYRERGTDGAWRGGPMLYLKNGLGSPFLAGAFAGLAAAASFGVGNMVQCNSIAQGLWGTFGVPPLVTGLAAAALLTAALTGGLTRITRVTGMLVPFMALFYMGGAVYVLFVHRTALLPALREVVACAVGLRQGAAGLAGYGMAQAVRVGVARGVFSNEAGLGSSVMVHAAGAISEPCEQGMWAVFEVFFDTIVMCTVTALVILSSGVYQGAGGVTGALLTAAAFSTVFGRAGGAFVALSLVLFAFSTLLGWSFYGQRAAEYLFGARAVPVYRALFVAAVVLGSTMRLEPVWALADTFNGLMALPNLAGVLGLRRQALAEWRRYARANHI